MIRVGTRINVRPHARKKQVWGKVVLERVVEQLYHRNNRCNGDILLSNNIQKGNYGEMNMDVYFKSQGYERISLDRVTDLNAPTHQGIDGVYYNLDGHLPYFASPIMYGG